MALRAVVFDFDGVIVNTEPLHLKAAQRVLADMGIGLNAHDYYERYLGFDDVGMFRAIGADHGVMLDSRALADLIERKSQVLTSSINNDGLLFPGAVECVRRCAAAVPLAIASGALGHEIDLILRRYDLREAFCAIVSAEDASRGKPAPEPYARAVDLLRAAMSSSDLTPEECAAIEDSPWGLLSARAAGLRCVAVAHTYPPHELQGADFVARTLDEITIERLREMWE